MLIMPQPSSPQLEDELRSLQYTAEERDRLFPSKDPFDLDDWLQSGPPATPEELEEMEELLRLRQADREASIARDLGLATKRTCGRGAARSAVVGRRDRVL